MIFTMKRTYSYAIPLLTIVLMFSCLLKTVSASVECPNGETMCPVNRLWTQKELASKIDLPAPNEYAFIADDTELTFVFHRTSKSAVPMTLYWSMGQTLLNRVEDTNYWARTLTLEDIDDAIVTFGLGDDVGIQYPFATYRGVNAPLPPPTNNPIAGTMNTMRFKSTALNQTRTVNIYLPPDHDPANTYPTIYMADGEALESYVGSIDYLITEGVVPPLIVVGMASAGSPNGRNVRGEEYVIGRNPKLFENHARFFTEEVREWAESHIGASKERSQRGIFGISNGGLFAIVMTVQHPDLYGFIFTFSAGASAGYDDSFVVDSTTVQLPLFVYGTAGTLEPVFLQTTKRYTADYAAAGADVVMKQNVAGHDDAIWQIEFVNAVRWMFAPKAD
jgi:enterochelin esterase-like enzyme